MKTFKKKLILPVIVAFVIGVVIASVVFYLPNSNTTTIENQKKKFIELKESIIQKMISNGEYSCCLKKPCTYCLIEKASEKEEDAMCDCLSDVITGEAPCGECIGEILEGKGNLYIAKYFAKAIASEVGEQHIDTLREIIYEKYGIDVKNQK